MDAATYDKTVIDEWRRRCDSKGIPPRILLILLAIGIATASYGFYIGFLTILSYPCTISGVVGLITFLRYRHVQFVACPHCNKIPYITRGPFALVEPDCCRHCNYWLIYKTSDQPKKKSKYI
jgi:purine-cytosine permease-like protein